MVMVMSHFIAPIMQQSQALYNWITHIKNDRSLNNIMTKLGNIYKNVHCHCHCIKAT